MDLKKGPGHLIKWAGSENIDPNASITWEKTIYFDAQKLDVLEKFLGREYINTVSPGRIAWNQAALLTESYQLLKENINAQLMAQTHLNVLLSKVEGVYDENNHFLSYNILPLVEEIEMFISTNPEAGKAQLSELTRFIKGLYYDIAQSLTGSETSLMNWQDFYNAFAIQNEEYKWIMDTVGKTTTDGSNSDDRLIMIQNVSNVLYGHSGNDYLDGGGGNDFIDGGADNDILRGRNDDDWLKGGTGNDFLYGGTGNDRLQGDDGNDMLLGEDGNDTLLGNAGNDSLTGGIGNDHLYGGADNDQLTAGEGNDTLSGGTGLDTLTGGAGDDQYQFNLGDGVDVVTDTSGLDTIKLGAGIILGSLSFSTAQSGIFGSLGTGLSISIIGTSDQIIIRNQLGLDETLRVEKLEFADGSFFMLDQAIALLETQGTVGNDILYGSDFSEALHGNDGADRLRGNGGNDILNGGAGNDALHGGMGQDSLYGGNDNDQLFGDEGEDYLSGEAGNDTLNGGVANDTLIGAAGNDDLNGGDGNDTYLFANGWGIDAITADASGIDTADFSANTGNLTVNLVSGVGNEVSDGSNTLNWSGSVIENIKTGIGNDSITGSTADNRLDGGAGNDTLIGSSGNDTYAFADGWGVDSISDSVGNDTVDFTDTTATIILNLTSGAGNEAVSGGNTVNWSSSVIENAIGGSGNDTITGNTAANRLEGGQGNDSLDGGSGNDIYAFSNNWGLDTISADSSGTDTIDFANVTGNVIVNLTSGAGDEAIEGTNTLNWTGSLIENVNGGSGDDSITGSSTANTLTGNAGNDTLTGLGGTDSLNAGDGDDTYVFSSSWGTDTITADSSGSDTIDLSAATNAVTINLTSSAGNEISDGTSTVNWASNLIENAIGGSATDTITGNTVSNRLEGKGGNDTLDAGAGDDTYAFASTWGADTISADTSGIDAVDLSTVNANLTINLVSSGGNEISDVTSSVNWSDDVVENVVSGTGNDDISGNSNANVLLGNDGHDTLTGAGGNDSLDGGAGDDTYIFAGTWGADTLTEDASGADTLDLSTVTATLTVNLVSGAGNEVTDGTNTIDWSGNVIENILTGSGHDTVTGSTANNSLDGGTGDDTYAFVDGFGVDIVTDASGNDTIDLSIVTEDLLINLNSSGGDEVTDGINTVNWIFDAIENAKGGSGADIITGSSQANLLFGNSGNDTLIAESGSDTLDGGAGDDSYVFADGWGVDIITSDVSGMDTVNLSAATSNLTITLASGSGDEVTDGTNTINWSNNIIEHAKGGSGNDSIIGNGFDNRLEGGAGNDTLDGADGVDIYSFAAGWGNDLVTDGSGIDTVDLSSMSMNITVNLTSSGGNEVSDGTNVVNWSSDLIENAFTGSGNDIITGNAGNNIIDGGAGNDNLESGLGHDYLIGNNGDDTINGGTGSDILDGGDGNDIFVFDEGWGAEWLIDSSGNDTVNLSDLNQDLSINLTSDPLLNEINLLGNTANWEFNIIENVTSGSGNDYISDNNSNNIISSGNGQDTIVASQGSDTLDGGAGNDLYLFANNWDDDTISDLSGNDTIDLSYLASNLQINLNSGLGNEVYDGTNMLNWADGAIENVIAGLKNDLIVSNESNNNLDGYKGDDVYIFHNDWGQDVISSSYQGSFDGNDTIDLSLVASNLTVNLVSGTGNEVTDGNNTINWVNNIIENVIGGSGADYVTGNTFSNYLKGGLGNDSLDGGAGDDSYAFSGAWGADTIVADSSGNDTVDLSAATNALTINLVSGSGNEITDGTHTVDWASNIIENAKGGSGADTIAGNDEANIMTGNGGNDSLDGGAGDDIYVFSGTWGADSITADSAGSDTVDLSATTSALTIDLTSSGGHEITDGTNTVNWASDVIENAVAGSGADTLTGNTSANRLEGGAGNDSLDGGSGNDTYVFANNWGIDSLTADSSGTDTVDFSWVTDDHTINLNSGAGHEAMSGTNTVDWSGDVIENAIGGSGNDSMTGNTGNNDLDGGAGNDRFVFSGAWGTDTLSGENAGIDTVDLKTVSANLTINLTASGSDEITDGTNTVNWIADHVENVESGSGNDNITGNAAANSITGGSGNDTSDGGDGDDTYVFANGWGIDTISDSSGADTLDLSAVTSDVSINMISSVGDEISDGIHTINWDGNVIDKVILGTGNNNVSGSTGSNDLIGGAGNDTFSSGAGNDTLTGNAGNDSLDGGADGDRYLYANDWGQDTIIDSAGNDTVDLSAASANLTIQLISGTDSEITDGANTINWTADAIENVITGTGFDHVTGNSAANSITAGLGNDTLSGGAGNDTLDGGEGHDTYVFGSSWNTDTIIDVAGNDTVDLSATNGGVTVNLAAGAGNEISLGADTVNWTGDIVENVIGGSGSDNLTGNSAANILDGGAGTDSLNGADGDDTYQFRNGWGLDSIQDSAGADTLNFSQVTSALTIKLTAGAGFEVTDGAGNNVTFVGDILENAKGGTNSDSITGSSGDNELYGNEGNDTLEAGAGNDTTDGGFGDDLFKFSDNWGSDLVVDDDGVDQVDLSAVTANLTIQMTSELEADEVSDGSGNVINWNEITTVENLNTGSGNDLITGNDLDNVITAGNGNDTINGGAGNDTYVYNNGWGMDTITGDEIGIDTIDLSGVSSALTINLASGAGNEVTDGTNTIDWSVPVVIENIQTGNGADSITGNEASNSLNGGAGADTLSGGEGDDTLEGGSGNDNLDGGAGDDTYVLANAWGVDTLTADSAGVDTVDLSGLTSAVTVRLTSGSGNEVSSGSNTVNWASDIIENAIGGNKNDSLTGNAAANLLKGNEGNDTLTGGAGDDTLYGGEGNDSYVFANNWGADTIAADIAGTDILDLSAVTNSLTINLTSAEDIKISDGTNSVAFESNQIEAVLSGSGNDVITGTSGNDTLGGGTGNDEIDGGLGDDTYVFGNDFGIDIITDAGGINTVDFSSDVYDEVEINLTSGVGHEVVSGSLNVNWSGNVIQNAIGSAGDDIIIGNDEANVINGYHGDDTINGGIGNDYLDGLSGHNTFQFTGNWGHDTVVADYTAGTDKVDFSSISTAVTVNLASGAGSEATDGTNTVNWANNGINYVLGGSGNDTIYGFGNDTLDGGLGNDTLHGGTGLDTYRFTETWGADTIASDSGGVSDSLDLSASTTAVTINLSSGAGHEATDGTNTVNWSSDLIEHAATGSGADTLTGNTASNLLEGNDGNDSLSGGDGNDTLEGGNGNDILYGGDGDDELDAFKGSNTLDGGSGNDLYLFTDLTNAADIIIDASGNDTIEMKLNATTTINLNSGAGNEVTMTYLGGTRTWNWTGDVIENVIGSFSEDLITGNAAANRLDGDFANDTISGGAGNDTIIGNSGSDSLDGGADDDTYIFGSSWGVDTITADSAGIDTVDFSGNSSAITVNLVSGAGDEAVQGSNKVNWSSDVIENVIGGSGANGITGNSVANILDGQGGNDTISAGSGNDTLIGGAGNDSLTGGDGDDTFKFANGFGTDTLTDTLGADILDFSAVTTAVNYNAASGTATSSTSTVSWNTGTTAFEQVISGSGNDSLTGSSSVDILFGNTGLDSLTGEAGNDELTGGLGNDSLQGGAGNDLYRFATGDGQDMINDSGDNDTVLFDSSVSLSNVVFFQNGSGDLQIGYTNSSGDLITVQGQSNSSTAVERFELSTGAYMTDADVNQILSDMASYAASNSISLTSLEDVKNDSNLVAIVNGGWNS